MSFCKRKKTISLLITTLLFMLNSWQFSSYSTPIYRLAHGQMTSTMKLISSTCHEQATLQKLWGQMGNSSLLPAKCWPLLHMIRACSWRWPDVFAGISMCFSTSLTHLLLYNKSLMDWSLVEQWILFPLNLNVPESVKGNTDVQGKQNSLFPSAPVDRY